jgi:hypothetical protein
MDPKLAQTQDTGNSSDEEMARISILIVRSPMIKFIKQEEEPSPRAKGQPAKMHASEPPVHLLHSYDTEVHEALHSGTGEDSATQAAEEIEEKLRENLVSAIW